MYMEEAIREHEESEARRDDPDPLPRGGMDVSRMGAVEARAALRGIFGGGNVAVG